MDEYDLVIIGSGPGGQAAVLEGARREARVLLVEEGELGGVCLNVGCIPTKSLLATAEALAEARDGAAYGFACGEPRLDLGAAVDRAQATTARLRSAL